MKKRVFCYLQIGETTGGHVTAAGNQKSVGVMFLSLKLTMAGGEGRNLAQRGESEAGVRGKSEGTDPWDWAHGCQAVITGPKRCDYWCQFRLESEKTKGKKRYYKEVYVLCARTMSVRYKRSRVCQWNLATRNIFQESGSNSCFILSSFNRGLNSI